MLGWYYILIKNSSSIFETFCYQPNKLEKVLAHFSKRVTDRNDSIYLLSFQTAKKTSKKLQACGEAETQYY